MLFFYEVIFGFDLIDVFVYCVVSVMLYMILVYDIYEKIDELGDVV